MNGSKLKAALGALALSTSLAASPVLAAETVHHHHTHHHYHHHGTKKHHKKHQPQEARAQGKGQEGRLSGAPPPPMLVRAAWTTHRSSPAHSPGVPSVSRRSSSGTSAAYMGWRTGGWAITRQPTRSCRPRSCRLTRTSSTSAVRHHSGVGSVALRSTRSVPSSAAGAASARSRSMRSPRRPSHRSTSRRQPGKTTIGLPSWSSACRRGSAPWSPFASRPTFPSGRSPASKASAKILRK